MKIITSIAAVLIVFIFFYQNSFAQPTFSAPTNINAALSPFNVRTADLNGDGKKDIVVTNISASSVSIFLNTTTTGASAPTFSAKTDLTTGSTPRGLALADLNGDGKIDIVVGNTAGPGTVSVLFNNTSAGASTPSFSAKTDFTSGSTTFSVAISDINGDGKPDIVTANQNPGTVSVLLNTTTPGSATPSFAAKTDFAAVGDDRMVTSADINGDGKPDIIVPNYTAGTVSVLLNTTATGAATASFSAKTDFPTAIGAYSIAVCDLNGDGMPDMAIMNQASLSVYLNTTNPGASTPTFSAKTSFSNTGSSIGITAGDLNNDGKPDIVIANYNSVSSMSVFINETEPGASTPVFYTRTDFGSASQFTLPAICDFNGDGNPDIVIPNLSSSILSIFMSTISSGADTVNFSAKTDFVTGVGPSYVSIADVNGDGQPDFASANFGSGTVSVFLNTTTPGASVPTYSAKTDFTAVAGIGTVFFKDLNGDRKPDIITANRNSTSISVLFNTTMPGASTPTFSAKTDFTTGSGPGAITTADFNGDGKPDIAVPNLLSNTVSVFMNTTTPGASTPTFSAKKDFTTGSGPFRISIADFNGDGKPDMVVSNSSVATVSVLLNTTTTGAATPTFSAKTDITVGSQPPGVATGDFNGDGKPDLVVTNQVSVTVSVLFNTTAPGASTPTFTAKTDYGTASNPVFVTTGDFNGDGKLDFVISNQGAASISVFLNNTTSGSSTPSFSPKIDFTTGTFPTSAAAADLNGDGKIDLAVSNSTAASVSLLLNATILPPLPVELASFTSVVKGNDVALNWSTVQEVNNKGFEIERNSFGAGWKKVGYIDGHGTTNMQQNYSFIERGLTTGSYQYRLKQIDYNGNYEYHELSSEVIIGVPSKFALAQNYPNPFNPATRINYELPITNYVSIKIFDITGKEVSSLVNEVKDAGYYSVKFDAKNLSSGTYFYKLSTDKFSDVKKMVVVK